MGIPAQNASLLVPVAQNDTGPGCAIQHPFVGGRTVGVAVNQAGDARLAHECVDRFRIDIRDLLRDLTHVGLAGLARDPGQLPPPCNGLGQEGTLPVGVTDLGAEALVVRIGGAKTVAVEEGDPGTVAIEVSGFFEHGPPSLPGDFRAGQKITVTHHEKDLGPPCLEVVQAHEERIKCRIPGIISDPGFKKIAQDVEGGGIRLDGCQPTVGYREGLRPPRVQMEVGDEVESHGSCHDSRKRESWGWRRSRGPVNMASMQATIRLRFAPSPTGAIHLGNARTALFNFLLAARLGGTFLIRVEDTDRERSELRHESQLLSDLRWLGLLWAEGPDVGGPHGPYRQSERSAIYARHLERCRKGERIYPCFCSMEQLARDRAEQESRRQAPRYVGRCGKLSRTEGERRLAQGESAVWRWRVGRSRTLVWEDLVFGSRRMETDELGDFVISHVEGRVGFLFANAVDDLEMEVSHVLRGEDHLSNTARQILLYEGLESRPPEYGHLPLLVNPGGAPLAKREGARSIAWVRSQGFLPDAVCNYLARLGHPYASSDLLDLTKLIEAFDLGKIGRARAVMDPVQLAHWQKQALARLDARMFEAWARDAPACVNPDLAALVRENVVDYADLGLWRDRLEGRVSLTPEARAAVAAVDPAFLRFGVTDGGVGDTRAFIDRYRSAHPEAAPARQLYPVLRAILTGSLEGPELGRIWSWYRPEGRRERFQEACRIHTAPAQGRQT